MSEKDVSTESMPGHNWIMCNACCRRPSPAQADISFYLTKCGHIFCQKCLIGIATKGFICCFLISISFLGYFKFHPFACCHHIQEKKAACTGGFHVFLLTSCQKKDLLGIKNRDAKAGIESASAWRVESVVLVTGRKRFFGMGLKDHGS